MMIVLCSALICLFITSAQTTVQCLCVLRSVNMATSWTNMAARRATVRSRARWICSNMFARTCRNTCWLQASESSVQISPKYQRVLCFVLPVCIKVATKHYTHTHTHIYIYIYIFLFFCRMLFVNLDRNVLVSIRNVMTNTVQWSVSAQVMHRAQNSEQHSYPIKSLSCFVFLPNKAYQWGKQRRLHVCKHNLFQTK